jgi:3-oxoadipate enol-lactonase
LPKKVGLGELQAAQELADSMPHAELQIIPEAGHIWNLERPELFTQTVIDFVQKVEGSA